MIEPLHFLSSRLQLGFRVMIDLAQQTRGGVPQSAQRLAKSYGLKPRALESVCADLADAGLIKGQRGPRGGYVLARERHKISLSDIAHALFSEDEDWRVSLPEALQKALHEIEGEFFKALQNHTLADYEDKQFSSTVTYDFVI